MEVRTENEQNRKFICNILDHNKSVWTKNEQSKWYGKASLIR